MELCWRVGKGDRISIVNSVWIPDSVDYRLANPLITSNLELVADLIEPTNRVWKEDLITRMFSPADAEHAYCKSRWQLNPAMMSWLGCVSHLESSR